ncbi:MAG: XisI protein [Acidobacteria bacterium]|nr:XisI protein [Acidobacteriota bacterium]
MEGLENYRKLIRSILTEHASIPYSHGDLKSVTVFDQESDHYLMMAHGWEGKRRVHDCMIHVDIIDGKFWIQYDGTEYGIAAKLREAGVPREQIVIAFQSPEMRKYLEAAVA